jgi:predicted metal-dependent phosphoesterase TrpH
VEGRSRSDRQAVGANDHVGDGRALVRPAVSPRVDARPDGVTLAGTLSPSDAHYVHVDLEVPPGVDRLVISFVYEPSTTGRVGFGLFGPGAGMSPQPFRGWSDHWRSDVEVGVATATPGYLPGPIDPGTWVIVLAPFELGERGVDWQMTVGFHAGTKGQTPQPQWAPEALSSHEGWYRGDLHVHSEHSADAPPGQSNFAPDDLIARAQASGLDFFASTDHNTSASHAVWGRYAPSDLLVLNGEEVTFRDGHLGAIGVAAGTWIDFRASTDAEVATRIATIHEAGGLAVMNHPVENGCSDCDWRFSLDHDVDAMEVWTNIWSSDNEARVALWAEQLAEGRRIPAVGGSDAHRPPDVVGRPQVVALAAGLSRASVLDALRAGRTYLAASKDLAIEFVCAPGEGDARQACLGDRVVVPPDRALTASTRIEGARGGTVAVHGRYEVLGTKRVDGDHERVMWDLDPRAAQGLLRVEVRGPDGEMLLMTNPIWVEATT